MPLDKFNGVFLNYRNMTACISSQSLNCTFKKRIYNILIYKSFNFVWKSKNEFSPLDTRYSKRCTEVPSEIEAVSLGSAAP